MAPSSPLHPNFKLHRNAKHYFLFLLSAENYYSHWQFCKLQFGNMPGRKPSQIWWQYHPMCFAYLRSITVVCHVLFSIQKSHGSYCPFFFHNHSWEKVESKLFVLCWIYNQQIKDLFIFTWESYREKWNYTHIGSVKLSICYFTPQMSSNSCSSVGPNPGARDCFPHGVGDVVLGHSSAAFPGAVVGIWIGSKISGSETGNHVCCHHYQ